MAIQDSYPLPRMNECFDSLGEEIIFSTLEENSGYRKIESDPRDREKTTFTSHHGLFKFTSKSFGLRNAHLLYISKSHGCYTIVSQLEVGSSVFVRPSGFFENR